MKTVPARLTHILQQLDLRREALNLLIVLTL